MRIIAARTGRGSRDDFSGWRQQRQSKRQLLGQVREHMEVVGSDGEHVGTVDRVRRRPADPDQERSRGGGVHHSLMCTAIDRVEGERCSST